MTTNEDWRPIAGWEGDYSMSADGRIRSEERRDRLGDLVPQRVLSQPRHNGLRSVLLWRGCSLTRAYVDDLHTAAWPELNGGER
jgi:hypothetical protein